MKLLDLFDEQERRLAVFPGLRREEVPGVVRHVDLLGHSGVVIYSSFSESSVDEVIREQMEYFSSLGQPFEWKVYAHDKPADLVTRLAAHGFEIDSAEAVMVLDLNSAGELVANGADARRVTTRAQLREVADVKARVYGEGADELLDQLGFELEHAPEYLSVYVACVEGAPAAVAWIRFPEHSEFASLWGGSTLPEFRHRGLYTSLLMARLDEARRRRFRYVYVDAGEMSRPILSKRGFRVLTYATACTWHG